MPRADDLDLTFCADHFDLAGGSIRACAVTAAYLADAADRPLAMTDVGESVRQEYRKLGRLVLASEFGPWAATWADRAAVLSRAPNPSRDRRTRCRLSPWICTCGGRWC
jgi:hypothetical protein